jgi:haloalkane dehalogenase
VHEALETNLFGAWRTTLTFLDLLRRSPRPAALVTGSVRAVTEIFRTPDERFEGLPGYDFEPHYVQHGDLRLHYVDTDPTHPGEPVVFMHGEPTWSYLWRKVIPPVRDAGFRCIAPDLPGFGRSDKPTDMGWYSYDAHVEAIGALLAELDPRGVTMVVHDWGGPIGLRIAVEHPDHIARIVILDTGLFTGRQRMSDAWIAFRDFVARTEDLPIGFLVKGACARDMPHDVFSAYEAPFPNAESKAGARAFPLMLPTSPDMPGAEAGQRVLDALPGLDIPKLVLWADKDPILTLDTGHRLAAAIGAPEPEPVEDASHFLQEDAGEEIGRRIAAWLKS